jgi:hypothetical protein
MTVIPATRDLGNGFCDHGVATPVSNHRGTVATVDGRGRNVVLVWLFDHRGGYALLVIDAETGKSEQIPMPFPSGGDGPFSSLLSSRNRFYTQFNSHFTEFDVARRQFTFTHAATPQVAMGMTEDDRGRIWAVSYPNSGVLCFDPTDQSVRDYGAVHAENWAQYQRFVAADDTGQIYFAIGNTASQIVAFDPASGSATAILPAAERAIGTALVYRDMDGRVYGQALEGGEGGWYRLYRGQATRLEGKPPLRRKAIVTASQALFHDRFPDGTRLASCNLLSRLLATERPDGTTQTVGFEYTSDGAHIMGVAVAPDGTLCGGTAFPMRFFSYQPHSGAWKNEEAYCQFNTVARQGDLFFMGGYIRGFLLEWDPTKPWVNTRKNDPACNPRWLIECEPDINRPHVLLAHPDGKTLVMGGTPGYGHTGGGLLIWDRATQTGTLLRHPELLPQHSVMSLVALPDGNLLGGSTTDPGTGGERKAGVAELFVFDMLSRRIAWHAPVLPNVPAYLNLALGANGIVYGMADAFRFFAFDPRSRTVLHEEDTTERFGPIGYQQGQRKLVAAPDGTLYLLLLNALLRVDQATHRLIFVAQPPVPLRFGGDILDGRFYFASASHLGSWQLPPSAPQRANSGESA